MNACGCKWVTLDGRLGDMSAPSTFKHFLTDSAWEKHFPPLTQLRPQKCEKMLLGNLDCTLIMVFLIFRYSTPNPSFCLGIILRRPVKIFWNCCQGSKYGRSVKGTKRDQILISMFALLGNFVHVAQISQQLTLTKQNKTKKNMF